MARKGLRTMDLIGEANWKLIEFDADVPMEVRQLVLESQSRVGGEVMKALEAFVSGLGSDGSRDFPDVDRLTGEFLWKRVTCWHSNESWFEKVGRLPENGLSIFVILLEHGAGAPEEREYLGLEFVFVHDPAAHELVLSVEAEPSAL